MHPARTRRDGEAGFDVGRHSAPLLRRMGEELAEFIAERLDLGPERRASRPGSGATASSA